MSGFVLAQSTLSTGFVAAEESVRFIDLMFGSNETSRALASIITLVAKELNDEEDKSWTHWLMGGKSATILTRLTKTATLFACLQHRTFDRIKEEMSGSILWDVMVSSCEKDNLVNEGITQGPEEPTEQRLTRHDSIITEMEAPSAAQLEAIDLDDAMTIVDADEYTAITSALPQSALPHSSSTAFYEVTTETKVTKTTGVQFITSTPRETQPIELRALRSRQVNTTTEKSKYRIAVQKVTDKLKLKKLNKPTTPKITEINDEEQSLPSIVKKALNRAKRGFSPSSIAGSTSAKSQGTSRRRNVSEFQIPTNAMDSVNVPPLRSRDTKANILRTRARTKSPEVRADNQQIIQVSRPAPALPPRPPPRKSSIHHNNDTDQNPERDSSPTKASRSS